MTADQSFTITFKTVAELTGLDRFFGVVQNGARQVEEVNNRLRSLASTANAALATIGLGLSIERLNEFGNKALEAGKQQAAFADQVLGSKEGSHELVEELNHLNEELERTTGTSKATSRQLEQLLLRAGATGDQVKSATRAIIEFAASSAGTVGPVELAAAVSKKLGSAADQNDISLGRLGIRAKDFNGAVAEMAVRGGRSAEASKEASAGMVDFETATHHAELAIGRFVNLVRVPFLTSFTGTLDATKEKFDGVTKAADKSAESATNWGLLIAQVSAAIGHAVSNIGNVAVALMSVVEAVMAGMSLLGTAANAVVVNAAETMTNKTIDALRGLAKFAAQAASTLSSGLIPDKSAQIDALAESLKAKVGGASDVVRKSLSAAADEGFGVATKALERFQAHVDAMGKGGKLLDVLNKVKEQYKALVSPASVVDNVSPGSRVAPPGEADGTNKAKAATDALTQSKFALASAEQTYKTALETTKLLEESGQISRGQANERNLGATRAYIAELERAKAALPPLIAQLEAVGNTKGAAEAKLEFQQLVSKIIEAKITLSNTSFFGRMTAGIRQLASEWSDLAKQISGAVTQTFQNFASTASQAITGLIFGTGNWRQSILQVGQTFVQTMIQMMIQWVLSRTVMSALNKMFAAKDAVANGVAAAASAVAWAPAATSASIATSGAAAGSGLTAFLAAIGAGIAAIAGIGAGGGFQVGGYTGDGPANRPAGIVHAGEVVFPAPRVRELGRDWLVNMAIGTLTRPGYQRGGAVGGDTFAPGGASANQPIHIINVYSMEDAFAYAINSPRGRKIINDHINNNRIDLGI